MKGSGKRSKVKDSTGLVEVTNSVLFLVIQILSTRHPAMGRQLEYLAHELGSRQLMHIFA